jgi:NlpC/P60 family
MGPAALTNRRIWILLGLLCLPLALRADIREEEQQRRLARADNSIWQVLFGQRVVKEAKKQLGKPYVWGAKDGSEGFDCSGLTAYVYGTLGVPLAVNAIGQYAQGVGIEQAGLLPGDLVFFSGQGSPLHVGIYAGDGQFLHAPGSGKVVELSSIDSSYFKNHYIGARRMTPALDEARRQRAQLDAGNSLSNTSTPLYKEKAP